MEANSKKGKRKPFKTYFLTIVVSIVLTLVLFIPIFGYIGTVYDIEQNAPLAKQPYVTWNGLIPQTQVYISWETDQNQVSFVAYGTSPTNLDSGSVSNSTLTGMHVMMLSGLTPDTQYYYQVGTASGQWFSGVGTFTTAPIDGSNTPFNFTIISDTQQMWGTGHYSTIINAINGLNNQAFVVYAGDVGEFSNDQADWNNYWRETAPIVNHIPIVPDPGNHDIGDHNNNSTDWENNMYTKYFGIATQTGEFPGHYYAFNYSDCQFVMAEIAAAGDEDPTYPFNNAQDQWLNATLLAGQAMDYRILVFHRAPYSANGDDPTLIDRLMPIIEEYNVSLVMYGHQHIYERCYTQNRTLICLGGGGGLQNPFCDPSSCSQITAMGPNFTQIYVNSTALTVKTFSPNLDLIDSVVLNKVGSNVVPEVIS